MPVQDPQWKRKGAPRPPLCARDGCNGYPIKGGTVCVKHGGNAPQIAKPALVRAELAKWTLGDQPNVDPGEMLLRLVAQSAARVERYSRLLAEAYEVAERVAQERGGHVADDDPNTSDAVREFHQVLSNGGISVLIGNTYSSAGAEGRIYATGEAIRGLVTLEAGERKFLADICTKAIAAGLAERQVRMAERQGALIAMVIGGVLSRLGHDVNDPRVAELVTAQLELVERM